MYSMLTADRSSMVCLLFEAWKPPASRSPGIFWRVLLSPCVWKELFTDNGSNRRWHVRTNRAARYAWGLQPWRIAISSKNSSLHATFAFYDKKFESLYVIYERANDPSPSKLLATLSKKREDAHWCFHQTMHKVFIHVHNEYPECLGPKKAVLAWLAIVCSEVRLGTDRL